jgi:hypothetical protein
MRAANTKNYAPKIGFGGEATIVAQLRDSYALFLF